MNTMKCHGCRQNMSTLALACPYCGHPNPTQVQAHADASPSPATAAAHADVETGTPPATRYVSTPLLLGIILVPVAFGWLLLRSGHTTFSRVLAVLWALLWAALVAATLHAPHTLGPALPDTGTSPWGRDGLQRLLGPFGNDGDTPQASTGGDNRKSREAMLAPVVKRYVAHDDGDAPQTSAAGGHRNTGESMLAPVTKQYVFRDDGDAPQTSAAGSNRSTEETMLSPATKRYVTRGDRDTGESMLTPVTKQYVFRDDRDTPALSDSKRSNETTLLAPVVTKSAAAPAFPLGGTGDTDPGLMQEERSPAPARGS